MASEWQTATIDKIAEKVGMGPFGSSIKVETFVSEGVPVISGQHLHGFRLDETPGFNFITPEHADKLKNANVQRGDVIFTHAGNIGQVSFIPENSRYERYVISQRQFYMRCDRRHVIPEFIVYYFKTLEGQHKLLANAAQVGVPSIAQPVTYLRTLEIPVPPLPEQRAIAHILGTLDNKIELNRRMNETLEAIARAIFKSWFVDFVPVIDNALRAGNPIPPELEHKAARRQEMHARAKAEGHDAGLPKHLADLFPDCFQDSEIGSIPARWNVKSLDEEFDLTMGQSPPGKSYNESGEGKPFYQGRADFTFRFPARRVYCTAPTRLAKAGDTLISVRAPVGDINMAAEDCAIGRGVAAVRHKSGSRSYTYYSIRSLEDVLARFNAEGTVFGCVGKKDFHAIRYLFPPRILIDSFEQVISLLDDRIEINEQESNTLASIHDALLPKLLSGDIQVGISNKA
jgi:type I restriction enzyme S subunit